MTLLDGAVFNSREVKNSIAFNGFAITTRTIADIQSFVSLAICVTKKNLFKFFLGLALTKALLSNN